MKTYVLTLSKRFLKGHRRQGQETYFKEQLLNALNESGCHTIELPHGGDLFINGRKLHTIRGNYELWEKRFKEIEAGRACLSIREWTGKPWRSNQYEIARLTDADDIGLQKLYLSMRHGNITGHVDGANINAKKLAENDGLSFDDWKEWFNGFDGNPMAIIHFTKYRY